MIDHRRRAEAPDQIAVELRAINRHLALGVAAQTFAARGFATAIAIADDVVAIVAGVVTGSDP